MSIVQRRPQYQELDAPSDEALEHQARAILRQSVYAAIRRVSCECHDGVLTLTGCVPSFFQKQVAQALLMRHLSGFAVICSRIQVPRFEPL